MINQSFAMNPEKTKKFGKLFNTIDFEVSQHLALETIEKLKGDVTIGSLHIGSMKFDLTLEEVNHLQETLRQASRVFNMKYRLGHYGK